MVLFIGKPEECCCAIELDICFLFLGLRLGKAAVCSSYSTGFAVGEAAVLKAGCGVECHYSVCKADARVVVTEPRIS